MCVVPEASEHLARSARALQRAAYPRAERPLPEDSASTAVAGTARVEQFAALGVEGVDGAPPGTAPQALAERRMVREERRRLHEPSVRLTSGTAERRIVNRPFVGGKSVKQPGTIPEVHRLRRVHYLGPPPLLRRQAKTSGYSLRGPPTNDLEGLPAADEVAGILRIGGGPRVGFAHQFRLCPTVHPERDTLSILSTQGDDVGFGDRTFFATLGCPARWIAPARPYIR